MLTSDIAEAELVGARDQLAAVERRIAAGDPTVTGGTLAHARQRVAHLEALAADSHARELADQVRAERDRLTARLEAVLGPLETGRQEVLGALRALARVTDSYRAEVLAISREVKGSPRRRALEAAGLAYSMLPPGVSVAGRGFYATDLRAQVGELLGQVLAEQVAAQRG